MPRQPSEEPPLREAIADPTLLSARRAARGVPEPELLLARASDAERAAVSIESRRREVERELAAMERERDDLRTVARKLELELRTSRQREFAEQQLREAAQDETASVKTVAEAERVELNSRLAAAVQRIAELTRELERARTGHHEPAAVEVTVLQRKLSEADARIGGLRRELEGAEQELDYERALRGVAEDDLATVSERAAAAGALPAAGAPLHAELVRGRQASERLAARLLATQAELDSLRARRTGSVADPAKVAALKAELGRFTAKPAAPRTDMVRAVEAAASRLRERAPEPPPLAPRRLPGGGPVPWLVRALSVLSELDPELAAQLFADLVPSQAAALRRDLAYDLVLPGAGVRRVTLRADGSSQVAVVQAPDPGAVDCVLSGPAAALAPLVAGGAPRRLRGVEVQGRSRVLMRLVRLRRHPAPLEQVALTEPERLVRALTAAIDPAWTKGHVLCVDVTVGDRSQRVTVADGAAPAVGEPGTTAAAADIRATRGGLVQMVLGAASSEVRVEGDEAAAATLVGWWDRALRSGR